MSKGIGLIKAAMTVAEMKTLLEEAGVKTKSRDREDDLAKLILEHVPDDMLPGPVVLARKSDGGAAAPVAAPVEAEANPVQDTPEETDIPADVVKKAAAVREHAVNDARAKYAAWKNRDNTPAYTPRQVDDLAAAAGMKAEKAVLASWRADLPQIGMLIKCSADTMSFRREEAFDNQFDGEAVVISMPGCGASCRFERIEDFPTRSHRCPCGRANHYIVKYALEG